MDHPISAGNIDNSVSAFSDLKADFCSPGRLPFGSLLSLLYGWFPHSVPPFVFQKNSWLPALSHSQIQQLWLGRKWREGVADLLLFGSTFSEVGRLVSKYNFYLVFCPMIKLKQLWHPMKDCLGLHVPSIYSIQCTFGRGHIGQTGHTILERYGEHARYIRPKQKEKSSLVEHCRAQSSLWSYLYGFS